MNGNENISDEAFAHVVDSIELLAVNDALEVAERIAYELGILIDGLRDDLRREVAR